MKAPNLDRMRKHNDAPPRRTGVPPWMRLAPTAPPPSSTGVPHVVNIVTHEPPPQVIPTPVARRCPRCGY